MAVVVGARHPERAEATAGEVRRSPCRRPPSIFEPSGSSARMTCGAPLVVLKFLPSGSLHRGLGALVHRVEGREVLDRYDLSSSLSLTPLSTARSIGSWSSSREASAPQRMTSSASTPSTVKGLSRRQLRLGQRAGLVRAQHVDAGDLLHGGELGDDGLLLGQLAGAQRHGDRQDRRHGHRHRSHDQDQHELHRLQHPAVRG